MPRFTLPRDIYYGRGSLSTLAELRGSRAIIVVGGGSMRRWGFLDKAERCLSKAGITTELFENVESDPSVDTVMRGAEAMRRFLPDIIVAMGGGSPIDAAKAMWVFYEHPEANFEKLTVPFSFPELRQRARFVAIPSTSGTATEVTAFSVITDYSKGVKYPLADFNITPDIAIVDPELAESMPKPLTANTGMDALTHAIEAYVSTMHGPFTDPLALTAIKLVMRYLPDSYNGDMKAREQMHYAQCMAGMAFSNALLGIVHSMAHKTGAAFSTGHVPHGCANAMYLPYVIEYNAKDNGARQRYAEIAKHIGLSADSEEALVAALIAKVKEYAAAFGIPGSLREFGVDEAEFNDKLPGIAELAVGDACTASNPRPITPNGMKELLRAVYEGTEVDF